MNVEHPVEQKTLKLIIFMCENELASSQEVCVKTESSWSGVELKFGFIVAMITFSSPQASNFPQNTFYLETGVEPLG